MTRSTTLLLGALFLAAAAPSFACDYPQRPAIPDGTEASKDEMLSASSDVKAYLASVDEYLNCIESAEQEAIEAMDSPSDEEVRRRSEMLNKRFDAANEEKALVGEMFNQQVRAYNAKRKANSE